MTDRFEVSAEVRLVGHATMLLGKELSDIISDTVMRNALEIRDFAARKEELLHVQTKYLSYFATSVCLYFAKCSHSWDSTKVADTIDGLARAMAQSLRYSAASVQSDEDAANAREEIRSELSDLYTEISSNFDRVTDELSKGKDGADLLFTLNMLYLTNIHPATATLLSVDDIPLLGQLQQAFGTAVWTAFRHLTPQAKGTTAEGDRPIDPRFRSLLGRRLHYASVLPPEAVMPGITIKNIPDDLYRRLVETPPGPPTIAV